LRRATRAAELTEVMRIIAQWAARRLKGSDYALDPALSPAALLDEIASRALCLLRGLRWRLIPPFGPGGVVFAGAGVRLRHRALIRCGRAVTLGRGVMIDALSHEGVHIGDDVNLGPWCILEASGVISNIGKGIRIGSHCGIGAFSYIGGAGGVDIGDNVIMGQRVSFHPENHRFDRTDVPIRDQGVTRDGIVLGDDCWVGANVTFLDGARVGAGCVIAAGTVVRGEIPPNSVCAGVPVRVLRTRGHS
jgi:acetyltransferase-like isoleucine patch superfamily enzyme